MLRLARAIDRFTERSALLFAWLLVPLLVVVGWEVVARYAFDAPTRWAYETIYMLYAAMFMLGAAYTLYRGAHIRTDFLYQNWPVKTQATVDALCYLLLFFPGIALFLWIGGEFAWQSWLRNERTVGSSWMPIIYPLKGVIPVAAGLLLLQGLSEFLKCIYALRTGQWLATPRSLDDVLSRES